jgi:hypothetical protein
MSASNVVSSSRRENGGGRTEEGGTEAEAVPERVPRERVFIFCKRKKRGMVSWHTPRNVERKA